MNERREMVFKGSMREYLEGIEACRDGKRLYDEFHMYDNFEIGFYGETDLILSRLVEAFQSSQSAGRNLEWKLLAHGRKGDPSGFGTVVRYESWVFIDSENRANAELRKLPVLTDYNGAERYVGELLLAEVNLMLHPMLGLPATGEEVLLAMVPPVADVLRFIINGRIPAVLCRTKEPVYNLPDS